MYLLAARSTKFLIDATTWSCCGSLARPWPPAPPICLCASASRNPRNVLHNLIRCMALLEHVRNAINRCFGSHFDAISRLPSLNTLCLQSSRNISAPFGFIPRTPSPRVVRRSGTRASTDSRASRPHDSVGPGDTPRQSKSPPAAMTPTRTARRLRRRPPANSFRNGSSGDAPFRGTERRGTRRRRRVRAPSERPRAETRRRAGTGRLPRTTPRDRPPPFRAPTPFPGFRDSHQVSLASRLSPLRARPPLTSRRG